MSEYRAALERLADTGIHARTVAGVNGLTIQLLEAGRNSDGARVSTGRGTGHSASDYQGRGAGAGTGAGAGDRAGTGIARETDAVTGDRAGAGTGRASGAPAGRSPSATGHHQRPLLLLLHGFPELSYSWRKVMQPLAEAGYYVVAPDQRGYGATSGWDPDFDGDLESFRMLNLVRDTIGLVAALGYQQVHAVIGHDAGAGVAAWCSLIRPDVFQRVALMSAPFAGPPSLRPAGNARPGMADLQEQLAALEPPRKHYQGYYSTRPANADMLHCEQGLHAFLRAYYHHKSADWPGNRPYRLQGWSAAELAQLPTYYVMNLADTMPQAVAPCAPSADQVAACRWLPDAELAVFRAAYGATGFQGGLQWYRCGTSGVGVSELQVFAGRTIDVPACFISGAHDWGVYQSPGLYERMQTAVCTRMLGCHLVPGAGHWVQQEQPQRVTDLLLAFFAAAEAGSSAADA